MDSKRKDEIVAKVRRAADPKGAATILCAELAEWARPKDAELFTFLQTYGATLAQAIAEAGEAGRVAGEERHVT